MHTLSELLTEARNLIIERGWTQGAGCRDEDGIPYVPYPEAVCFCMIGAIQAAPHLNGRSPDAPLRSQAFNVLTEVVEPMMITEFNDHPQRTKDEVVAAYNKAIEVTSNAN